MIEYSQWTKAYEHTVEAMTPKDQQIRKDYISEYTKWLIDRREEAKHEENREETELYTKLIKKHAKWDKITWINELTKETLESDEIWEGMKTIARGYKPMRYARRDRHGNIVDLKDRAKATKDYLEKEHWGIKEEKEVTEHEKIAKENLIKKCKEIIKNSSSKFSNAIYNTNPLTLKELKAIIRKYKNGKAPGPDNITTDWVKDLDNKSLEQFILPTINKWWQEGKLPDNATQARVVSLYKKGCLDKQ